jgi:hypothetical protein
METCPQCQHGTLRIIAAITYGPVLRVLYPGSEHERNRKLGQSITHLQTDRCSRRYVLVPRRVLSHQNASV